MQDRYFDIGVNLTHESFENDYKNVIENAFENSVDRICLTGTSIEDSEKCIEITEKFHGSLISTVGVHPHYADNFDKSSKMVLKKLALSENVKAIGETGLDFKRNFSLKEKQIESFHAHIEIANDLDMPMFLHQRDAHKVFIECINEIKIKPKAVVHCFTGNISELEEYLNMDLYIGITGWLCDPVRGKDLRRAIVEIPLNRLMIETDSPYLLPKNLKVKGRRNEPKFLPEIFNKVDSLRSEDSEEIKHQIYLNSLNFFNLNE